MHKCYFHSKTYAYFESSVQQHCHVLICAWPLLALFSVVSCNHMHFLSLLASVLLVRTNHTFINIYIFLARYYVVAM